MGPNCTPLVADLFLFCIEEISCCLFSGDKDADLIGAFNSTSRYLDDLLNIDNTYTRPKTKRRYQIFHFNVAFLFQKRIKIRKLETESLENVIFAIF